ncbi:hypothetical protein WK39_02155 [Burkholderia cepacia]|nr:hypothetical protein WK39_02155 [Burkholderia cepacia]KVS59185.1 hypothetical protein WK40_24095 [Burkholderia cepacia]
MPVSHLGADSPDAKAPGPGLRVTAARARSCIFGSRLFGKTVRPTIGNIRTRDLGRARTETGSRRWSTTVKIRANRGQNSKLPTKPDKLKRDVETFQTLPMAGTARLQPERHVVVHIAPLP